MSHDRRVPISQVHQAYLQHRLVGCGTLKVDSPNQQKKKSFPQMWDLKNILKIEVESNFFRIRTAEEKVMLLLQKGEISF